MTVPLRYILLAILFAFPLGCKSRKTVFEQQKEVLDAINSLSEAYLDGDVQQAKECLNKSATILQQTTILEPSGRADLLTLTYFRLYCLDERIGDKVSAKADLVRAKYWRLTAGLLSGGSSQEVIEIIDDLGTERIQKEIDSRDSNHHNGHPARYISLLKQ